MENNNEIIKRIIKQIENDKRIYKIKEYVNKPVELKSVRGIDENMQEMEVLKSNIMNGNSSFSENILSTSNDDNDGPPRTYPAKRLIVKLILDNFLEDYLYFDKGGFSKMELLDSKLFTSSNTNNCEDLIISTIEGIPFRCSDVDASMFLGCSTLYEFDFGKTFQNDVVLKKSYRNAPIGFHRYKTLNSTFNSMFNTYAFSKYDSLLVLTPHIMEYLISLNEKYSKKLEVSFVNKKLYIKFSGYNLFNMSKTTTSISEEKIKHFASQLEDLHILIKFLKEILLINSW